MWNMSLIFQVGVSEDRIFLIGVRQSDDRERVERGQHGTGRIERVHDLVVGIVFVRVEATQQPLNLSLGAEVRRTSSVHFFW